MQKTYIPIQSHSMLYYHFITVRSQFVYNRQTADLCFVLSHIILLLLLSAVKKSLDKHPALSAEMSKETLNRERTPSSTIPPNTEAMIDFTNLTLSRENILIDTHALVKAFQQASKLFTGLQSHHSQRPSFLSNAHLTHILILLGQTKKFNLVSPLLHNFTPEPRYFKGWSYCNV